MAEVKRHDWGLIVSGILLVVLACLITAFPGLTMATITTIVGIGFIIAGVFSMVGYTRFARFARPSGWMIAYGVLDFILGMMFVLQPVLLADVISWMVGFFVLAFGIFELVAAVKLHAVGLGLWGWMIFSGIVDILCGVIFFVWPAMLAIFLAVFVIMRGLSLIVYGWKVDTIIL